ncbi:hypothetical protein PCASD_12146 [Puccinia coronata f. sp. avenae]|uniref:Uncharacterized protein n=1 Tax=Puccinia coronata f. sp. avenae TaxID=200324 RepID=A0A2N5TBB4_9BASI|nr:hypothetical protein PCASD_12146 [Puccinia coronata f. sp. avenae]
MLAFKIIFALSIAVPPLLAGAFVAAHPLKTSDQLAPRDINSITTATTASTSYQSLTTRIQTLRYNIAKGQYTYSEARSQIQSFSYEASTTLTAINGCPTCFRSGSVYTLTQSAQRTYTELDSLVDTCYRVYPQQAPSLFTSSERLPPPSLDRVTFPRHLHVLNFNLARPAEISCPVHPGGYPPSPASSDHPLSAGAWLWLRRNYPWRCSPNRAAPPLQSTAISLSPSSPASLSLA